LLLDSGSLKLRRLNRIRMAFIRGGGWVIVALRFLAAYWAVGQNAGAVRAVGQLKPHRAIERELGAGQTDEYTVRVGIGFLSGAPFSRGR